MNTVEMPDITQYIDLGIYDYILFKSKSWLGLP